MDSQRNLFLIAFLFVSFVIWQTWQLDHEFQSQQMRTMQDMTIASNITTKHDMSISEQSKTITIRTDVLSLTINVRGGDVIQAQLLDYLSTLGSSQPFQLLETSPKFLYQAQSGLIGNNGPDNPNNGIRPLFTTTQDYFTLSDTQSELRVPMTFIAENGAIYTKIFILRRGEYAINVEYQVNNTTQQLLEVAMFGQLKQSIDLPKEHDTGSSNFALNTFRGAAYSTDEEKYEKYNFNTIADNKHLNISTTNGWVAMLQQYFATAWIPRTIGINRFYTNNLNNGIVAIGYKSASVTVKPGSQHILSGTLWIGPEIQDKMKAVAPYLDLIVDYGWLWFISQPMFKLLKFLHTFIGNWGFSIIMITFIVRGIMYPLTKAQYVSMAKMRMLQPKIQEMHERFGDNKQRLSQEMITLYKSEKVNPLGGCLPLVIQMPIFLALYYMLIGSIELRHAPFVLWINDLSAQDPYYILPILMGVTMFFIQKLSSTTVTDSMQRKIITFMPLIFTGFFLWFPSGLVLYYIVSNLVTILQQYLICHGLEKRGLYSRDKQ